MIGAVSIAISGDAELATIIIYFALGLFIVSGVATYKDLSEIDGEITNYNNGLFALGVLVTSPFGYMYYLFKRFSV